MRRVAVALTHHGLAYDHWPWSVWVDADRSARYDPLRRVPVLIWGDGSVLIESFGSSMPPMIGSGASARSCHARARCGERGCASLLATGLADKAVSLLYEHVLRKPEARNAVWADRCAAQIRETLARLEVERARALTPPSGAALR